MPIIETALGPIGADLLGSCSMHEHALVDLGFYATRQRDRDPLAAPTVDTLAALADVHTRPESYPANLRLSDEAMLKDELRAYAQAGGHAIVDQSCLGIRGDMEAVRRAAVESGVHIILSTGLYVERSWPDLFLNADASSLYDFMMSEIEIGIAGSDMRAGHIGELGITDLSAAQREVLAAASGVAAATNTSMTVHVGWEAGWKVGIQAARHLVGLGADPSRVVFGHVDVSLVDTHISARMSASDSRIDLTYARDLLGMGFSIAIDTFGWDHWQDRAQWRTGVQDWERITIVKCLVEEGYASQIVLGTDVALRHLCRAYGGRGYAHFQTYVLPALLQAGVSPEAITSMTTTNPRRLLSR